MTLSPATETPADTCGQAAAAAATANILPYRQEFGATIYNGNSLEVLKQLPDSIVDAVITDPPYEISLDGSSWDSTGIAFSKELWTEAHRVLKPGGHMAVFGSPRTIHRVAVAVEDSGFAIKDTLQWHHGGGLQGGQNITSAIEALIRTGSSSPTAQRKAAMGSDYKLSPLAGTPGYGTKGNRGGGSTGNPGIVLSTPEAIKWEGWSTNLRPQHEPILLAMKPIAKGRTIARNLLEFGTGGLHVGAARIGAAAPIDIRDAGTRLHVVGGPAAGGYPTNVLMSHTDKCELDEGTGAAVCVPECPGYLVEETRTGLTGSFAMLWPDNRGHSFFYAEKPKKPERPTDPVTGFSHLTVKPLALMSRLIHLLTQPGGVVLDMFAGSGPTIEAALLGEFEVIAVDSEPKCMALIDIRMDRFAASRTADLEAGGLQAA